MRKEAESHGPIRYVINTEHHVDHIFGNYWFKGTGQVVHHRGVHDNFMVPTPDLDPFAYALEAIPTDDPDGAAARSLIATPTTRTRTGGDSSSPVTWSCASGNTPSS